MNITVNHTASPELLEVLQVLVSGLRPVVSGPSKVEVKVAPPQEETASQEFDSSNEVQDTVSLEQVRKVVQAKIQSGSKAQIADLLTEFGAKSISKLEPTQFADFLKRAEAA